MLVAELNSQQLRASPPQRQTSCFKWIILFVQVVSLCPCCFAVLHSQITLFELFRQYVLLTVLCPVSSGALDFTCQYSSCLNIICQFLLCTYIWLHWYHILKFYTPLCTTCGERQPKTEKCMDHLKSLLWKRTQIWTEGIVNK